MGNVVLRYSIRVVEYDINLPEVSFLTCMLPYLSNCFTMQSVQHNGSMWADIFLTRDGASPDPANPKFDWQSVHRFRKRKCSLRSFTASHLMPSSFLSVDSIHT